MDEFKIWLKQEVLLGFSWEQICENAYRLGLKKGKRESAKKERGQIINVLEEITKEGRSPTLSRIIELIKES